MTWIVATSNPHKMEEIRKILANTTLEVLSMREAGFDGELEETGDTFRANAAQKVRGLEPHFPDAWIFADDSGLVIDALDGAPGVYSARFLGDASYPEKIAALNAKLDAKGVPAADRNASFRCAIALKRPGDPELHFFDGRVDGYFAQEPAGSSGFGYDPAFYVPELGHTLAEVDADTKNALSHRGRALRAMEAWLKDAASECFDMTADDTAGGEVS